MMENPSIRAEKYSNSNPVGTLRRVFVLRKVGVVEQVQVEFLTFEGICGGGADLGLPGGHANGQAVVARLGGHF